jgi:DNA mismatch repair protein MutS2
LLEELETVKKQKDAADFAEKVSGARTLQRQLLREAAEKADPVSASHKDEHYRLPRALKPGDAVVIRSLGAKGSVISGPDGGGNVTVQAGILKTTVPLTDLMLSEEGSRRVTLEGRGISAKGVRSLASRQVKQEINLLGLDSIEAIAELQAFLDQAVLGGLQSVRIIHGKGSGVLRKAVQQYLKTHRNVAEFRLGAYGEGESGVTIAQLK